MGKQKGTRGRSRQVEQPRNLQTLIERLESAVRETCVRLGWEMEIVQQGQGYRKIQAWLPMGALGLDHARVLVFLDSERSGEPWEIINIPVQGLGVNTRRSQAESATFTGTLRQRLSKLLAEDDVEEINPAWEDSTGYDKTLVEMWNQGYSRTEIAQRVRVSPDRVTNRVTELRNKLGAKVVPYDRERKKRLIAS